MIVVASLGVVIWMSLYALIIKGGLMEKDTIILLGLWGIVGIYLGMGIVTYIIFKQIEKIVNKLDRVIEILDLMSKKQEKTPYLRFSWRETIYWVFFFDWR